MNKKLMAVAVAGIFATPVVAHAQNSTVQIYGKTTFEYGYADQGSGRPNTDILQAPGGSNVGFKGEEKLGGGLSGWFQCESSADVRGLNQDGFCSRNSAIGLKGAYGNVHFGRWDTPFKRAFIGQIGAGDTGLLGGAFLLAGNSTGTGALGGQGASQSLSRNVWKRRETGLIYYESPQFSGFQILAAFSPANSTAVTDGTQNAKPRVESISGMYSNGPLNIAVGYEKHVDFGNGSGGGTITAPTGTGNDDHAWTVGATYTFMGKLQVGAQYLDAHYEMGLGADVTKKNWYIGANWNFSGPHHIMGAYIDAGDSKGSSVQSPTTSGNGPIAAPAIVGTAATAALGCPVGAYCPNGSTGAKLYEIAYAYDFSKRTNVKFGYVKVDNDTRAGYSLGGLASISAASPALGALGSSQSAWVLYGETKW